MRAIPIYRCVLRQRGTLRLARKRCRNAKDAEPALRQLIGDADREHLAALYLEDDEITGAEVISVGDEEQVGFLFEHVLRGVLLSGCDSFVLAHNHVRCDPGPSPEDRKVTRDLLRALDWFGIRMRDHLILATDGSFYSFRHHGLLGRRKRRAKRRK